jgi:hypothetical protein
MRYDTKNPAEWGGIDAKSWQAALNGGSTSKIFTPTQPDLYCRASPTFISTPLQRSGLRVSLDRSRQGRRTFLGACVVIAPKLRTRRSGSLPALDVPRHAERVGMRCGRP